MFACCVMRSGTIPTLLRSDRGPELKNALMAEYCALVGLGRRFGTPWRPVEQGLIEGEHNATLKIYGMLVKDVMQCFPNETGELRHVVEFIVYNTPGPHGYTPRDIDRRWSLAMPLEKEMQPFTVCEFEPMSEYVAKLFSNYREIRVRVLGWLKASSEKRADLANRFRVSKDIQIGQKVVLRDPRQRKAGGRTPYRQPYTDPCSVEKVTGNKMVLRKQDGTLIENIHMEDVLVVPDNIKDYERNPTVFEEEALQLDSLDLCRSPGMMLEDQGRALHEDKPVSPGKLEKINAGNFVVFTPVPRSRKVFDREGNCSL